jgi:hypothetical protein
MEDQTESFGLETDYNDSGVLWFSSVSEEKKMIGYYAVLNCSTVSGPALGPTHSPIRCVPGVKRPGREASHSPSGAEVKNGEAIPPLPHMSRTTLPLPSTIFPIHY